MPPNPGIVQERGSFSNSVQLQSCILKLPKLYLIFQYVDFFFNEVFFSLFFFGENDRTNVLWF